MMTQTPVMRPPLSHLPVTTIPIVSVSISDRPGQGGKPLWTHHHDSRNYFLSFETQARSTGFGAESLPRYMLRIFSDDKVHEEVCLNHLLRLAEIDRRSGMGGNEKQSKLNMVVRKPLLAVKYTSEDFQTRRFQIKFKTAPDTGFETALQCLRDYGLTLKEFAQPEASGSSQQVVTTPEVSMSMAFAHNGRHNMPLIATEALQVSAHNLEHSSVQASSQMQPQHIETISDGQYHQGQPYVSTMAAMSYLGQDMHSSFPPLSHKPSSAHGRISDHSYAAGGRELYIANETPEIPHLTSKPVARMLSFSTPPSSHHPSPGIDVRIDPSQSSTHRVMARSEPDTSAIQESNPQAESYATKSGSGTALNPRRRPFFQRPTPLQNEVIDDPEAFQDSVTGTNNNRGPPTLLDTEPSRPATAPPYPGSVQLVSGSKGDAAPPKRQLPFAVSTKAKTAKTVTVAKKKGSAQPKKPRRRTKFDEAVSSFIEDDAGDAAKAVGQTAVVDVIGSETKSTPTERNPSGARQAEPPLAARPCDSCRQTRGRCDKIMPKCGKCRRGGHDCQYSLPVSTSKGGASKGPSRSAATNPTPGPNQRPLSSGFKSAATQISMPSADLPDKHGERPSSSSQMTAMDRAQELMVLAKLMSAADGAFKNMNEMSETEPRKEPNLLSGLEAFNLFLGNTPEQRAKMLELSICKLLKDDAFIALCAEVEDVCNRNGILV